MAAKKNEAMIIFGIQKTIDIMTLIQWGIG